MNLNRRYFLSAGLSTLALPALPFGACWEDEITPVAAPP